MKYKETVFNDNSDVFSFIFAWFIVLVLINSFWWVIDFNNLKEASNTFSLSILIVLNFGFILLTSVSILLIYNYFYNKKVKIINDYIQETVYKTMEKKYGLHIQALRHEINMLKEQNKTKGVRK